MDKIWDARKKAVEGFAKTHDLTDEAVSGVLKL